jgi:hypothetical protein
MKAFALGMIVGGMVCFGVTRVIDGLTVERHMPEHVQMDATQPVDTPAREPSFSADPDEVASMQPAAQPVQSKSPQEGPPGAEPVTDAPTQVDAPPLKKRRLANNEVDEKEALEICEWARKVEYQRERDRKDAEPKDPGWAYSMEQLIRQHIEANVPKGEYTQLRIDCRTTFCELEAEGTSKDGREHLMNVGQEIPNQPWSDVTPKAAGSGTKQRTVDTWYVEFEWYRPQNERERRLWQSLRNGAASQ